MVKGSKSMTKNLTIVDIAKSAGVSKTTVSRYLNGRYEYMSAETRERIKKVIEVSGYQPNKIAQSLKSQKSMLIGFVVADIESPFSSATIKSVGDAMLGTGYNLITVNSDNSYDKEKSYIQSLLGQQVDGLIVNTVCAQNPALISLANAGLPIVLMDRFVRDYNFDIAYFENEQSIHVAMEHLRQMGYGQLIFCTQEYEMISPRNLRRQAFEKKLAEWGEQDTGRYVRVSEGDQEHTERIIRGIIQENAANSAPPALICSNTVTLLRAVRAIKNLGLEMPYDIGICGFDEWGWATELGLSGMIDVGLTVIKPDMHELGIHTTALLLNRIQNPDSEKREIAVPAKLVVRNSTRLH